MQSYNKFYRAIFKGKVKKSLKINRYTMEEVVKAIMEYIPENDEGIIEIFEIDFDTKQEKSQKRILMINELTLIN
ncbi:MAG: hypothetical protein ACTSUN_01735 [Promethearchaeota archaeon]